MIYCPVESVEIENSNKEGIFSCILLNLPNHDFIGWHPSMDSLIRSYVQNIYGSDFPVLNPIQDLGI